MSRKWHLEDWRKIYTRLDAQWLALPWVARSLASDLIKYCRDDGFLCEGKDAEEAGTELARIVSARTAEVRLVKDGVKALLDDGYLVLRAGKLVVRNHAAAQQRLSPDARRKARQRDRAGEDGGTPDGTGGGTQTGTKSGTSHGTGSGTSGVTRPGTKTDTSVTDVPDKISGVESSRVESSREKPDARGGARTGGSSYGRKELAGDWERLVGVPAGDASQLDALLAVLGRLATARGTTTQQLAQHALPSVAPVIAGWGGGSGRRYTPTAGLVADVRRDGRALAEVLAHADRERPPAQQPVHGPHVLTATQAQRELDAMAARAVPPPSRWQPPVKAGAGGPT